MTDGTADSGKTCQIKLDGTTHECPVVTGTEQENGIDISKLRSSTGYITLDSGYGNTGACKSDITFIDGEKGILRYRGYPIEQLAEKSSFLESSYLLIYGKLPTQPELDKFETRVTDAMMIHEGMHHHFEGFPATAHPMAMLSAMINAMGCYHPDLYDINRSDDATIELLAKVNTIAAFTFKEISGQPFRYPHPEYSYAKNFLHMMFSKPHRRYEAPQEVVDVLDLIFVLHADHEQNCSTSTVRMVGSSQANLFGSISAGVCALWGPLHGGANQKVIEMLENIRASGTSLKDYIAKVKDKSSDIKLMGFGHRVYKNHDPRATILKKHCDKVLDVLGIDDPCLDIARELEEVALNDEYFISRNLYPNVDFYSGIVLRALGIPVDFFTVIFAIGRMPGWIAHWREMHEDPTSRINRPRQIYTGANERDYVPMNNR